MERLLGAQWITSTPDEWPHGTGSKESGRIFIGMLTSKMIREKRINVQDLTQSLSQFWRDTVYQELYKPAARRHLMSWLFRITDVQSDVFDMNDMISHFRHVFQCRENGCDQRLVEQWNHKHRYQAADLSSRSCTCWPQHMRPDQKKEIQQQSFSLYDEDLESFVEKVFFSQKCWYSQKTSCRLFELINFWLILFLFDTRLGLISFYFLLSINH